ncbi:conserved oligomeric Golgi complex subunit 3 isoform X1 [Patella vulgata]|uniref:conserved oligomeric Golgi complex subunit 3 isoform X1 n=1 Tax=Patella vulgata TaxID=6465 RepID=UPI002180713F|nr:conserved oligomeric Golgi complex subunit 3 isoform X1 [Patella vulgata]
MADTLQQKSVNQKIIREKLSLWESKSDPKASLSRKQKDSLIELTEHSNYRPIPEDLPVDDAPVVTTTSTEPLSPRGQDVFFKLFQESGPPEGGKIENAQQFFSWFSELEENIDQDEESQYRNYTDELNGYRQQCNMVLDEVTQALDYLKTLQNQYINVSTKTNTLHEACEHLLAEQTKLMNFAEGISNKLSYFNEFDSISSKLGSPTLSVTNESFIPMLSRMDECIHYFRNNARYKESQTYLARFKQCLSRALGLIKTHVTTILQNATQQVQPKKDTPNLADNAFTLFYGKFRANAPRVKSLTEQLEIRVDKSPEYAEVLTECHQCYFLQREKLLGPSIASTVTDLAAKHYRDHCALVRSGCAFMVHVCEDEYQLFFNFFSKPTPLLDQMLEKMCNNLYDVFRPLIIHVNHLETLSELCSILKIEMMEEHISNNSQELAAFEVICKQMLMDVQERLVYRTYIYIKSDILNYSPASGDLAYPEKLEMMESIAESLKKPVSSSHSRTPSNASSTSQEVAQLTISQEDQLGTEAGQIPTTKIPGLEITPTNMPMSPADLHGMWYPTVRRTLVTLSKLYRCIDRTTFQGLSQEALQACIDSLKKAEDGISKRKVALDGQLFLVKHLLILREQIAPFHADFSIRETHLDFTKFKEMTFTEHGLGFRSIRDAAYALLQKKSQLFALNSTNALLHFILEGTPQVTEFFVDSKHDVDQQLKKTCEDFIHHVSDSLTGPLKAFLSRASVVINMKKEEATASVTLRQQPFATPEKVHDVVAETYKMVKTKTPGVLRSMALYLANKDTESILFKPIKVNVQQCFQQLEQILQDEYNEEDRQIVACPSSEQVNLLLSTSK